MHFDDYQQYLKYVYNSLLENGQVSEVIEVVKNQKNGKPFDYEFNTKEGDCGIIVLNLLNQFKPASVMHRY